MHGFQVKPNTELWRGDKRKRLSGGRCRNEKPTEL